MKERRGDEAPLYVEGCVRLALGGVAAVAVILYVYTSPLFSRPTEDASVD
jgi:hypothetical protein